MADSPAHASLLQELDARQDDLLAKLAELNQRVDELLKQYLESRTPSPAPSDEGAA